VLALALALPAVLLVDHAAARFGEPLLMQRQQLLLEDPEVPPEVAAAHLLTRLLPGPLGALAAAVQQPLQM
jgi:hypothetical protein